MADQPASERTEQPTAHRLRKAREQGEVPQSAEVPTAFMMAALLLILALMGPRLYRWFVGQVQQGLTCGVAGPAGSRSFASALKAGAVESLLTLAPFLVGGAAVSVFASLIVGGWAFSPQAVRLDIGRISPVRGLKSLFSLKSLMKLLVSLAKLGVVLTIVYYYMRDKWDTFLALHWTTPGGLVGGTGRLVFGLLARIAIGLMAIAVIDMLYQKWQYKRRLRMTRQEIKEERKQYEVSPELRGRIRAVQIEMVRKRMLQEVPKADVVVTNPTHVAVAMRYDADAMDAPQVVAKGGDLLGERIKEIARAHGVPVLHRPELARALYATVEVGQTIPETLFVAVAEVLAMIYRLRKKRHSESGATDRQ